MFFTHPFNFKAVIDTALDIAKAMHHLHLANVLHSDLKAANVMLKTSGSEGRGIVAKVADFGLSVSLNPTQTHCSNLFQGTLTHMAPEVIMKGCVSKAADTYAFGITLWELLTGQHAFQDIPSPHLGHAITAGGKRPTWGCFTPAAFSLLAEECWQEDAAQRPAFAVILERLQAMRSTLGRATPALDMSVIKIAKTRVELRAREKAELVRAAGQAKQGVLSSLPVVRRHKSRSRSSGPKSGIITMLLDAVPEGQEGSLDIPRPHAAHAAATLDHEDSDSQNGSSSSNYDLSPAEAHSSMP